jgi:DNA polymerase-3 subunit gamma/tau
MMSRPIFDGSNEPTMDAAPTTYTVLARRYRPQSFDEIIGQGHVAQSLRNAILSGRVGHAYLFTGARGVGKTSTARIFAKALNCPNAANASPCNRCDVCESIAAGSDVDVHEIDGASNTGVDNVRDLRANVTVTSMRSKYKIYIIDEVHMLSKSAFNALLKTLEEPPPNVKFIFCTTEPTKVPDTVLSRCQRFDFGTIALPQIVERLADIAKSENMEVEPAALELVARRAAGSMRDSQSLFDQLLASADKRIVAADVHRLLGTTSDERLMDLFDAIIQRERQRTLSLLSQALLEGAQLDEFVDQVLNYLRDLMVLAVEANSVPLMSVSETNRSALEAQAKSWGLNTILAALQIVSETKLKMQRATFGRALLELALIRLTLLEQLQSLDVLLNELAAGSSGRRIAAASSASVEPEKKKPEAPSAVTNAVWGVDSGPRTARQFAEQGLTCNAEPSRVPSFRSSDAAEAPPDERNLARREHSNSESVPASSIPTTAEAESSSSSGDFQPGSEPAFWTQVMSEVGDDVGNALRKASRVAICGPNELEVEFPKSYLFAKSLVEQPEAWFRLKNVVTKWAGRSVEIRLRVAEGQVVPETSTTSPKAVRRMEPLTVDDPYVDRAIEVFNAKVVQKEKLGRAASQDV